jgi:leader peptidase (prepilin peptidase) / N-methyltransferase
VTLAEAVALFPGAQLAVATALGLIFGSFANVCIHRLPEGRSVVWPGSACPQCGRAIAWYDNIPVISWIVLRGRCRGCAARIPVRYPLVEALCGALLLALCLQHGLTWRWAALSWLAISIVVLVPIDQRHGILPDRVTLPGIAAGLGFSFLAGEPTPAGSLRGALVGALVPLGVRSLYIAYVRLRERLHPAPAAPDAQPSIPPPDAPLEQAAVLEADASPQREGMGLGDVKMLAMVGAFLGAPLTLLTMLLGSVLGTAYVLPLLATGRHGMKTPLPFGPFLGVAALVAAFWGNDMLRWYLDLLLPAAG